MILRLAIAFCLIPMVSSAQSQIIETEIDEPLVIETDIVRQPLDSIGRQSLRKAIITETREPVSSAPAAILRGLDKVSGDASDIAIETDGQVEFGRLSLKLQECRYPSNNPTGDAYVKLSVTDRNKATPIFDGWMVASSPALMGLDHPRYDIWAIRCKLDNRTPEVVAGESSPRPLMRP